MAARKSSGSRAFFLELILDIVVFALCATVCLQVFAAAKNSSDISAASSRLSIEAQTLAEDFKALGGDMGALASKFPVAETSGQTLSLYYDKNFASVSSSSGAVYLLRCEASEEGGLHRAKISAQRIESPEHPVALFEFTVARFLTPGTAPTNGGGA